MQKEGGAVSAPKVNDIMSEQQRTGPGLVEASDDADGCYHEDEVVDIDHIKDLIDDEVIC